MRSTAHRLRVALGMVAAVTVFGTAGYVGFGFTPLDALYQTITTKYRHPDIGKNITRVRLILLP